MTQLSEKDRKTIQKIEKQLNEIKNKYDDRVITERVKTFEDALELVELSDEEHDLLDYSGNNPQMISTRAHLKVSIIAKALNEGWEPDWSNSNETKYYPWMKYSSGVGFAFDDFGGDGTCSGVGSRLCFKSRELAEYAGKQFQSIYNEFLN